MIDRTEYPIFSVSEFVEYINIAIGQRRVRVSGEISGYHLNQGKWVFFDLKDEESKIGCFAASWNLRTPLEDGMAVVIYGTPRIYPKSGKFSIMVEEVELKGEGTLRRALELTRKKLELEGLFDITRKRPLPRFPEKIGVIASRESAAYTDFFRMINGRWGGLEIYLYHVSVQGEQAVHDIVTAFQWFNEHGVQQGIESLTLIRGGGSLDDLQAFNSEAVCRVVFGSKIPVVCGVGHERDETLADYAADVRAATPTHAATLIVADRHDVSSQIVENVTSLKQSLYYGLEWHQGRTKQMQLTLGILVHRTTQALTTILHGFALCRERLNGQIDQRRDACTFFERTLVQMNPLTVLKRGYTIVKKRGTVISSVGSFREGDTLELTFVDGSALAEVKQV